MDTFKTRWKKVFNVSHSGGTSKNPYLNPNHPNHNPAASQPAPSGATALQVFKTRSPPPQDRPASPRGSSDFLAEARAAVGRDRVTGRSLASVSEPNLARRRREEEDRSAFAARNHGVGSTSGLKYDLFVQEMQRRKERDMGLREPEGGFYAPPPKQATEFYAPGSGGS